MKLRVRLCVLVLLCSGCGHGATAHRIRDTEGGHYPLGEVHFVEHARRGKGVLVAVTEGVNNPLGDLWTTMLVPVGPGPAPRPGAGAVAGPAWASEGTVHGRRAHAIAALPDYRSAYNLTRYGDSARARFGQHFVWVLGTNPFVLGLPSAEADPNWRQVTTPQNPWPTRFATDAELSQTVRALVVYPGSFWEVDDSGRRAGMKVSFVTLGEPLRVSDALDAIAAGNPWRLGTARIVALDEPAVPKAGPSRAPQANRDRPPSR